ncbi:MULTISPECIES: hypothetical protein [unclassified Sulfuricurvum]|uniref:hypothetical protein n=1 Tax=unclassified Sulfuricurvum TaxID=2632390 RepID=UPI0002995F03|nr:MULTISPECIES: hypothetical protein [unclassified Sulfuricurvum]OHD83580.1 MAG: hypothetical protein A3D90_09165 [Sulfuricurvum sp. RIFCSPHIGHO2_02_FULL_43_9]OHD84177.1 MAG: hypothetical protein A2Y52_08835 [Sulfuricurvum sp. RIFCSPLOWO2_02_43_6]OHD87236.1 MAG: hypothetical protein A2W83_04375 [Sulfuricurvum sp. RIFCSPLOWO2_12_43_5]AFV96692.1 hypothetical protein B649_01890 [Candidatus Sulfuricurvum sp. RIFRC-1]OHD90444.1 MAG: hypothetical protein A3G19_02930 [Sulfuricurvum sp. RIFCSPLOWO2_1
MKFVVSKKLSESPVMRIILIWMFIALGSVLILNLIAKAIDYGTDLEGWTTVILGNEMEFIDPIPLNDLVLQIHTDLFALIMIFVMIAAVLGRSSFSHRLKAFLLGIALVGLLLYPLGWLSISWFGSVSVAIGAFGFILYHTVMLMSTSILIVGLIRKRI